MIIWCLYGEETPGSTPSQEGKRLPLVNTKVLQQSETGAKVPVTVEIRFLIDGDIVDFKRSVWYEKNPTKKLRRRR